MIYSTTSTYAVMALVALAIRGTGRTMHVRELADATGISSHFLAKIIRTLVRAGILDSIKGKKGGIHFARSPAEVSVAEVVKAIEGKQALHGCLFGLRPCNQQRSCPLYPQWGAIRNQIIDFLESTTILDIASKASLSCGENTPERNIPKKAKNKNPFVT